MKCFECLWTALACGIDRARLGNLFIPSRKLTEGHATSSKCRRWGASLLSATTRIALREVPVAISIAAHCIRITRPAVSICTRRRTGYVRAAMASARKLCAMHCPYIMLKFQTIIPHWMALWSPTCGTYVMNSTKNNTQAADLYPLLFFMRHTKSCGIYTAC